jgi:pyruvate, water dikinase
VELAGKKGGYSSEPSYGTHFFQDLVETKIYPLAISQEEPGDCLDLEFIRQAADQMPQFFPEPTPASQCIKLIHIPAERPGCLLEIAMDGKQAVAYLRRPAS